MDNSDIKNKEQHLPTSMHQEAISRWNNEGGAIIGRPIKKSFKKWLMFRFRALKNYFSI